MKKPRVLFVCTHNGARSRIAEKFANLIVGERIEVHSASFESERIGPLPISVMDEIGIAVESSAPKSVFERAKDQELFDYVIALCDPENVGQVYIFLSAIDTLYHKTTERINWSIPNFRAIVGTDKNEKIARAREIRDEIKTKVTEFSSKFDINPGLA